VIETRHNIAHTLKQQVETYFLSKAAQTKENRGRAAKDSKCCPMMKNLAKYVFYLNHNPTKFR